MTIGAWIGLVVALLIVWGIVAGVLVAAEASGKIWAIVIAILVIISVAISALFIWFRTTSASGQRALKDQQSNLSGGIERTVSVYDINGNLIKQYSGKFDIETDRNNYILFDDENGDRHVIYYTTGTIIIDEK